MTPADLANTIASFEEAVISTDVRPHNQNLGEKTLVGV